MGTLSCAMSGLPRSEHKRTYLKLVKICLTPVGNEADFIRRNERVPNGSTWVVTSLNRGEHRRAHRIPARF